MGVFREDLCISPVEEQEFLPLQELFNTSALEEIPYQKISIDDCRALFGLADEKNRVLTFCAKEGREIAGFVSGCIQKETAACFLTFILTAKEKRRRGIGTRLLDALMEAMKKEAALLPSAPQPPKLQISFFNPHTLTWIVPGTPGHDHPNAPGVDTASAAYLFFKNRNFLPGVYQNSFYLPLTLYKQPSAIVQKKAALSEQKIEICPYVPDRHTGLWELTENLGNPVWKKELLENDALKEKGYPLAAAIHENKIIGFAGPLRVQESGRGYFAGIGVHSDYRGFGLGNVLFHTLCASLKEMGAAYMTLFTGETNPAGQIYLKAGFRIVKSWADMEIPL